MAAPPLTCTCPITPGAFEARCEVGERVEHVVATEERFARGHLSVVGEVVAIDVDAAPAERCGRAGQRVEPG